MLARMDFRNSTADEARVIIKEALEANPRATRIAYAALAQKTWLLLTKGATEDEFRDWQNLCEGVRAFIRESDAVAAERLRALSDLLRESISEKVTLG